MRRRNVQSDGHSHYDELSCTLSFISMGSRIQSENEHPDDAMDVILSAHFEDEGALKGVRKFVSKR